MLKLNPSLNPYDYNHAGATDEEGVPFFLAKKTPKKLTANDGTKFTPSYVQPQVLEEIASVKTPKKKVVAKPAAPKPTPQPAEGVPPVPEGDFSFMSDFARKGEENIARQPANDLIADYFEFMNKRKGRQEELDNEHKALKEQGRPSGFQALDLTPAYAFVDQMTGSKLTNSYKAPTVAQEYDAKLKAAQELALGHEGKLVDDQFGFMKYDTQNNQFIEDQNRDDIRLDKQLKNAMEIAKINAQSRRDSPFNMLPYARFNYQQERDMQEDMRKLSKDIAPFATSVKTIENAEALLKQFPDAPGVGGVVERLKVFDSWTRDNGQFRNALALVVQAYTKEISGAAFTDQERVRYEKALGDIATSNPRAIAHGLEVLKELSYGKIEQAKSGYTPEVQGMYERNNGFSQRNTTPKPLVRSRGGTSGAPAVGFVNNGYRFKGGNHRDKSNWEKVK